MRRKKKIPIRLKIERVLLGDVLPYETPVIFSNRYFYEFLIEHNLKSNDSLEGIEYSGDSQAVQKVLDFFPLHESIPFSYKIAHKENDFRVLSVIHPSNQIAVIKFYDRFKDLILYYTNISSFSIRHPARISSLTSFHDVTNLMISEEDEEHELIEEFGREYKNLKTFFAYEKYSNIHKFYESYPFHQAEKKYKKLVKFDISKCFDSIYTHSISWALASKDAVKDGTNRMIPTFGSHFDKLMQRSNHNETNGILIGPEFSRIFAEVILQRVDKNVERALKREHDKVHRVDYEIFRYVDDFFVFSNSEQTEDLIVRTYRTELKEYKLTINDRKTNHYQKPIITQLTMAKNKLAKLLDKRLKAVSEENNDSQTGENPKYSIYVSSNKLITEIKTIVKETDTSYKDILNFTLAVIDRRALSILKKYVKFVNKNPDFRESSEKKLVRALLDILDVSFFLYSVAPRVNTTIKLSMILIKIIKFAKALNRLSYENQHVLLKKIFDEVSQVLSKQINKEHTQVETIYLLLILSELGREYRLNENRLAAYFHISKDENGKFEASYTLNYWSITLLLFYMRNIQRYNSLRDFLKKDVVEKRFKDVKPDKRKPNTELTLLLLDLISCPFLDLQCKRKLLFYFGVKNRDERDEIIKLRKYWFIKWINFDLERELNSKRSKEVY